MTDADIENKLNEVFRKVFDDDSIKVRRDMTAADIDGWDSLSHIGLIVAVEKAFSVKFTTSEVQSLANVGDFMGLIGSKLR
jgi:acyl carrier protein